MTLEDGSSGDDVQNFNQQLFEALSRIAQGDLNAQMNGGHPALTGEDRQLLLNVDGLVRRLRYIVSRLQRAADSIDTVVGEVLRGTQALSAGVLDEAKSVEETSSSISEINASMHSVGGSLQTLQTSLNRLRLRFWRWPHPSTSVEKPTSWRNS